MENKIKCSDFECNSEDLFPLSEATINDVNGDESGKYETSTYPLMFKCNDCGLESKQHMRLSESERLRIRVSLENSLPNTDYV